MEKITYKLANLKRMLTLLTKAINKLEHPSAPDYSEYVQDSVVARFKILIESTWKVVKLHLEERGTVDLPGSPKDVIEAAREAKFLNQKEYETFLSLLKLRNMASPIYDQPQYLLVVEAAPRAAELVQVLIHRLEKH